MANAVTKYCQEATCECKGVSVSPDLVSIISLTEDKDNLLINMVVLYRTGALSRSALAKLQLQKILRDNVDNVCGVVSWKCQGKQNSIFIF